MSTSTCAVEDAFESNEPPPVHAQCSATDTNDLPTPAASNAKVQAALIIAQICFGLGGVISALGLPACNPFAFALYREVAAGALLLLAAHLSIPIITGSSSTSGIQSSPPILQEWRRFTLLGLALFGNQAGVIAGIKLAGPVAAAVWQNRASRS